jgi:hypothetical protein
MLLLSNKLTIFIFISDKLTNFVILICLIEHDTNQNKRLNNFVDRIQTSQLFVIIMKSCKCVYSLVICNLSNKNPKPLDVKIRLLSPPKMSFKNLIALTRSN